MKWKIEDVGVHCNILFDLEDVDISDAEAVGIGFPRTLAERLVKIHNDAIEKLEKRK